MLVGEVHEPPAPSLWADGEAYRPSLQVPFGSNPLILPMFVERYAIDSSKHRWGIAVAELERFH
jgi:hypothetical protein